MKRTLHLKLLGGYLAFGLLGFLTIATFTSSLTNNYLIDSRSKLLYKEATLIASRYAINYFNNSMTLEDVQGHLEVLDTYLSTPIWIVSNNGDILINSREPVDLMSPVKIKDFDPTSSGSDYYQIGDFYNMFTNDTLSVIAPITNNYRVSGYVTIHMSLSQIASTTNSLLNISYITLFVLFLCAFVVLGMFTILVYFPIRKITRAADEYAHGNFDAKLDIHTNDELGYLAASLNYMATEVKTLEDNQKKFIANVSHDFRSPLTSIKGYIEAILDGTIPYELQEKYLNIILYETERLNKLTQVLLSLNDYGKKGSLLDITDFDINQIIKSTAESFEGTGTQKKIVLELILTGQTLLVSADMSKLQQVLYNLIDNALKFSHSNSTITVETTTKNEKVFVSVKDTGIGIPKDSLKKIWERFYKSDLSRGKDKKGTGLGLAIVKEIIQAHNENINVISTEGVGTEFIFTLPLSKLE